MCGIAGWGGGVDATDDVLRRMCSAVRHRGPDDEGYLVVPGRAALGFRRLAIIDLTTGNQPLYNEDGSVAVVCNGEIYNFPVLRRDLERRGHAFSTGSDVEVVAHLYEEHGPDCLSLLHGMFAIAVWDQRRERLMLARDRLGVKPLYWCEVPGGLIFGSEPAALLASGLIEARADPSAIAEYLTLQYVPPPRTGFAGINKLAPGERLLLQDGKVSIDRWWDLRGSPASAPGSLDDQLGALDELLRDATKGRLLSDVPVGAFLSGGVDSSVVVSYMAELKGQVSTFSIDFPHDRFSEAPFARRVAEIYGTKHEELLVDSEIIPTVARTVSHAGEPFADSSAIPTYILSELTKRRVTVALSGDGGDEAFAGYTRYLVAAGADRLGPFAAAARPLARALAGHGGERLRSFHRGLAAVGSSPHDRYAGIMAHFTPTLIDQICTPEFLLAAGGSQAAWEEVLAQPDLRGVDRYRALDTSTYLPGDLLLKVDRMSMAHALEVRSPLLDHRIHEFAAGLPAAAKVRGLTTKWLLKELATRRGLPRDLVHRRKQGFGVPIGHWFRTDLRPWVEGILTDRATRERGYFRGGEVERLLADHVRGADDHTHRLWNLVMLELWHREYIDASTLG